MAVSRYIRAAKLAAGAQLGTSSAVAAIRAAVSSGAIRCKTTTLRGAERLDTVAGDVYGDGRYWWVLAAASEIGWPLQCPAGTAVKIPDLAAALDVASRAQ